MFNVWSTFKTLNFYGELFTIADCAQLSSDDSRGSYWVPETQSYSGEQNMGNTEAGKEDYTDRRR